MKKIVIVYQSLLGLYGDHGNAVVLAKRLQWRGIDAEIVTVNPGEPIPTDGLIYLLGGGEDMAQVAAVSALRADGGLAEALKRGALVFGVCAGYQVLGHSFTVGERNEVQQGLGILDIETRRGPSRAIGEVLEQWSPSENMTSIITGFENHAGYTKLGSDARPLARVELGVGNCGDGYDGAIQGRIIGCYPHGPILPRNPRFADWLLEQALGEPLPQLNHPTNAVHEALRARRIHVARTTKDRALATR